MQFLQPDIVHSTMAIELRESRGAGSSKSSQTNSSAGTASSAVAVAFSVFINVHSRSLNGNYRCINHAYGIYEQLWAHTLRPNFDVCVAHQNIKQHCWCCCQVSFAASSSSMVHGCTTSHIAEDGTARQHRERQRELKHKKYQKDNSKSKITTATFNSSFPFPLAPSSDLDSHQ